MITILKETPITFNGRDCMEQLVYDNKRFGNFACDLCCYRNWDDNSATLAECVDEHGCTLNPNVYFRISEINREQP